MNRHYKGGTKMKRQHIPLLVIASASILVVGITLAAQDRYTLKSPKRYLVFGIQGLRGMAGDFREPDR